MDEAIIKDSLICAGCGHPVGKHHFFVHVRGTKDEYKVYHSECLKLVKRKNKADGKKTIKDA